MQKSVHNIQRNTNRVNSIPDAFVLYRLPGSKEKTLMSGHAIPLAKGLPLLTGRPGFVLAPFQGNLPVLWLDPGNISSYASEEDLVNLIIPALPSFPGDRFFTVVKEDEYKKQVEKIQRLIQEGDTGKVVLSRLMMAGIDEDFNAIRFFNLLCNLYPDAFVYLACFPGYAAWAGATPETLLGVSGEKLLTMALAGTRKSGETGKWDEKDVAEHNFVVDYIGIQLEKAGCYNIHKSEACSVIAGEVMHLRTGFSADCRKEQIAGVVKALHPTPAVCGWPAEKALKIIESSERHERAYYTGYLGPVGENTADLFVNLRCMQLFKGKVVIYTGGGLTADSDPQKEWDETVLKSTTMLSAMEKMRNLAV